jgi:hypothetical protein
MNHDNCLCYEFKVTQPTIKYILVTTWHFKIVSYFLYMCICEIRYFAGEVHYNPGEYIFYS